MLQLTVTKEKVSVIWNHKIYEESQIEDFYGFIAWLVRTESFVLLIDERGFKVDVSYDGWAYIATTENFDGPEDHINLAVGVTRAEALEALVEKLSEAIYEEKIFLLSVSMSDSIVRF